MVFTNCILQNAQNFVLLAYKFICAFVYMQNSHLLHRMMIWIIHTVPFNKPSANVNGDLPSDILLLSSAIDRRKLLKEERPRYKLLAIDAPNESPVDVWP